MAKLPGPAYRRWLNNTRGSWYYASVLFIRSGWSMPRAFWWLASKRRYFGDIVAVELPWFRSESPWRINDTGWEERIEASIVRSGNVPGIIKKFLLEKTRAVLRLYIHVWKNAKRHGREISRWRNGERKIGKKVRTARNRISATDSLCQLLIGYER